MSGSLLAIDGSASGSASADTEVVGTLRSAILADDPASEIAHFTEQTEGFDADALSAVFLAVEEDAIAHHRRSGIPLEITVPTLADVGRKIDAYGATVDRPWLVGLLRGEVLAFGRLQVEREATAVGRALHIPEGEPLAAEEIDDSLARCKKFLGGSTIICTSWLFDPALVALPEGGNIAAFVRRFEVGEVEPSEHGDRAVAKFVFRRPLAEVLDQALVMPATSLERIVAEHLRSGHHWSEPRARLRASGLINP